MLNIPVGVCIQGTIFNSSREQTSHEQHLSLQRQASVVTGFLSEELKNCTLQNTFNFTHYYKATLIFHMINQKNIPILYSSKYNK
jgi:hypothetical protein